MKNLPTFAARANDNAALGHDRNGFDIKAIDLTDALTRNLLTQTHKDMFSQSLGEGHAIGATVGRGDVLDIVIRSDRAQLHEGFGRVFYRTEFPDPQQGCALRVESTARGLPEIYQRDLFDPTTGPPP